MLLMVIQQLFGSIHVFSLVRNIPKLWKVLRNFWVKNLKFWFSFIKTLVIYIKTLTVCSDNLLIFYSVQCQLRNSHAIHSCQVRGILVNFSNSERGGVGV